jgi:hypothetical protein
VEIEANGDSMSTFERGPSLVGSLGLLSRYKRYKIFLSSLYTFSSFVSIAEQAGQEVVPRRLSIIMCLWVEPLTKYL